MEATKVNKQLKSRGLISFHNDAFNVEIFSTWPEVDIMKQP